MHMSLQAAHNYRYTYTQECCGRRQYGDEGRPEKKYYEGVILFSKITILSISGRSSFVFKTRTQHYISSLEFLKTEIVRDFPHHMS